MQTRSKSKRLKDASHAQSNKENEGTKALAGNAAVLKDSIKTTGPEKLRPKDNQQAMITVYTTGSSDSTMDESSSSLPFDIIGKIATYSDDSTLSSLDVTCKAMRKHTGLAWACLAKQRFGEVAAAGKGKMSWRTGISLISRNEEPIQLWNPEDVESGYTAVVAENGLSVVVGPKGNCSDAPFQSRDCRTLELLRDQQTIDADDYGGVDEMVVCGSVDNAIIVISTGDDHVIAYHGDGLQTMLHDCGDDEKTTKLLGKEDLLLVYQDENIHFYKPNLRGSTGSPFHLVRTVPADYESSEHTCSTMAWSSPCKEEFGFSKESSRVCIWSIYADDESAEEQFVRPKLIETLHSESEDDDAFVSLAINGAFVVAVREEFLMVVFDRQTGSILHEILPSQLPSLIDDTPTWYFEDITMSIHGIYLTAAYQSDFEYTFAVWDLKSGTPLFRALEGSIMENSMGYGHCPRVVQLSGWDYLAFFVPILSGPHFLWGFPKSQEDKEHFDMIRAREARLFLTDKS